MTFRFVDKHRDVWPVRLMCAALRLPAGVYYAWRSRPGYVKAAGIRLNGLLERDSLREIVAFTSRASACTILPHAAVLEEVSRDELRCVPVVDPVIGRNAYVVCKQGQPVTQPSLKMEAMIGRIPRASMRRHHLRAQFPLAD